MHRWFLRLFLGLPLAILLAAVACSTASEPGPLTRAFASLRSRFSSGQSELQRALDAKKAAHSWRMVTVLRAHPGRALETVIEVSCPDHERITTTLGDTRYEAIRIGNQSWIRSSNAEWVQHPATPDTYPCGANPGAPAPWAMMNEGRDPATVIATMARNITAQVSRGDQAKVGNDSCQQWVVSFQHPGSTGRAMTYTMCIDASDHLPREVAMGSGGMTTTYSDWNKPIHIEPPAPSVQSSKTTASTQ